MRRAQQGGRGGGAGGAGGAPARRRGGAGRREAQSADPRQGQGARPCAEPACLSEGGFRGRVVTGNTTHRALACAMAAARRPHAQHAASSHTRSPDLWAALDAMTGFLCMRGVMSLVLPWRQDAARRGPCVPSIKWQVTARAAWSTSGAGEQRVLVSWALALINCICCRHGASDQLLVINEAGHAAACRWPQSSASSCCMPGACSYVLEAASGPCP